MEHDEISLDAKPSNRQNAGRYGNKTNKSIKFNPGAAYSRRKDPETITEILPTPQDANDWQVTVNGANRSIGISLNANKNWEWVEKQAAHQEGRNNLRQSQDDFEVDYSTRVAVLVQDKPRVGPGEKEKEHIKIYGTPSKSPPKEEIEYVSGSNRKGFYVKEKRRKGKKGVKRDTLSPNNNRRPRSRSDAGNESSSSESSSDDENDQQLPQDQERILVVEKKTRTLALALCRDRPGCSCSICSGWTKNQENKRRVEVRKVDIDAL